MKDFLLALSVVVAIVLVAWTVTIAPASADGFYDSSAAKFEKAGCTFGFTPGTPKEHVICVNPR